MNKDLAKINMIKQQLRTSGVINETILELYQSVKREDFVPPEYHSVAYSDMQIPLNHDECMLTPVEEALILQNLNLQGHETVLEVGTGTGFLTALLSKLAKNIISIDYHADFTVRAKKICDAYACTNIEFMTGDAHNGWLDKAPYDVIIMTGGIKALTDTLKLQVLLGGQLFAILGKDPIMEGNLYTLDHEGQWHRQFVFETNVPSLIHTQHHQPFVF